jgi:undecaprenyl-diphosphatase
LQAAGVPTLLQILYAIIIGVIQGISEWLPISSKTQVLIASEFLLGLSFQQAYTFGLFMEVGTILAAVIYFRRDILSLLKVVALRGSPAEIKLFKYVVVTTVVTGLIGAPLYLAADSVKGVSVGIPMLVIGAILIGDAMLIRYSRKGQTELSNRKRFDSLRLKDYVIVGITQGIAALPGVSRSGITTSAMLLMDVEPDEAFRLSFLVGIFASAAAFALTLLVSHTNVSAALSGIGIIGLGVAILTATVISLFLIDFLIRIAGKSKIVYVIIALGIIALGSGVLYLLFAALGVPVVS